MSDVVSDGDAEFAHKGLREFGLLAVADARLGEVPGAADVRQVVAWRFTASKSTRCERTPDTRPVMSWVPVSSSERRSASPYMKSRTMPRGLSKLATPAR
ncbi:hypothetical protein [Streptomyces fradiae]|uniref:hypothetical protein n=1 Tax=Streptomyces fradiae TaxID=1906 RepID=UPI0029434A72|nr:hypothetical protein [Streptomyces fradiae]WOI62898.1 hypothetical protein RYQ63_25110 [Streptomyces fradiae]